MKYKDRKIVTNCVVCGNEFIKRTPTHKYCSIECREIANRKISRVSYERNYHRKIDDFSKGRVWVLDMNSWEWNLEVRGEENEEGKND